MGKISKSNAFIAKQLADLVVKPHFRLGFVKIQQNHQKLKVIIILENVTLRSRPVEHRTLCIQLVSCIYIKCKGEQT